MWILMYIDQDHWPFQESSKYYFLTGIAHVRLWIKSHREIIVDAKKLEEKHEETCAGSNSDKQWTKWSRWAAGWPQIVR